MDMCDDGDDCTDDEYSNVTVVDTVCLGVYNNILKLVMLLIWDLVELKER